MWKFQRIPPKYWDEKEHVMKFASWLAGELHLNAMEDWYKITKDTLLERGGTLDTCSLDMMSG